MELAYVSVALCRSAGNKFVEKSVQFAISAALALQEVPAYRVSMQKKLGAECRRTNKQASPLSKAVTDVLNDVLENLLCRSLSHHPRRQRLLLSTSPGKKTRPCS